MLRQRSAIVVLVPTLAWAVAGAASAAGRATVAFAVTVAGSQHTVVTGVRSGVDELGCTVRTRHADTQTLRFASRGEGRLVSATTGHRLATARVQVAIQARGTRRSTRTVAGFDLACDVPPETTARSCGPVSLRGSAVVRLPARGAVGLAGSLARRRDAGRCAPAIARARPFLAPTEGRFPVSLLSDRSAARIILRGDARFTDTLASGARRVTTLRWTVTLRRLS